MKVEGGGRYWRVINDGARMVNELFLIWKELGMGFFLYEWRSHEYRKNNFPMNGLAGIVKENFPMSGEAANGETFFYYDC